MPEIQLISFGIQISVQPKALLAQKWLTWTAKIDKIGPIAFLANNNSFLASFHDDDQLASHDGSELVH